MDIVVSFTRKRKNFGKHCYFSDKPAEIIADIQPNPTLLDEYVIRNPAPVGIQCSPSMSEHWVNTDKYTIKSQAVLHQEGGWPKDIDSSETEPKVRFRKKIEKDDEYITSVKNLSEKVEYYIKLNNAVNIYQEYFGNAVDHTSAAPSAKVIALLRDPGGGRKGMRKAACSSWHPELLPSRIAVAYSIPSHNVEVGLSLSSYIWHIETTTQPFLELIPSSPLCSIAYNPRDENIILGGARNGLLCFWDVRRGSQAVDTSPIERSHKDAVYEICWLASKTATEFCSASPDGTVLFWDTRKLGEPVETIILPLPASTPSPSPGEPIAPVGDIAVEKGMGGVSMEMDPSGMRFLVGTEQGVVLWCNKKGKSAAAAERVVQTYNGHHGPIYSVKRNPFYSKYFLTVGDWSTKIWSEEIRTPLITSKYYPAYLTDGCWSPTRPGVFFTTRKDGTLDIWDYLYKTSDPALSVQIGKMPIWGVGVSQGGQLASVCADDGSTTVLRLGDGLSTLQPNEKATISQLLDKEARREKNLDAAAREREAKVRKQPPAQTPTQPPAQPLAQALAQAAQGGQPLTARSQARAAASGAELAQLLSQVEKEFFDNVKVTENGTH